MPLTRLNPVFRALGHPTRRWIVEQLLDFEASICELAEPLLAAEDWLRRALWTRYKRSLGSMPEDWGLAGAAAERR